MTIHTGENTDVQVRSQESRCSKPALGENIVSRSQDNHSNHEQSRPSSVGLERRAIGKFWKVVSMEPSNAMNTNPTISRISLLFQASIEPQVSALNDDPPDQTRNRRNVDKPTEDRGRITSQTHVHQR